MNSLSDVCFVYVCSRIEKMKRRGLKPQEGK